MKIKGVLSKIGVAVLTASLLLPLNVPAYAGEISENSVEEETPVASENDGELETEEVYFVDAEKLATPKNLRWVSGKPLTLTWDKVPNADHYFIYIYNADSEDQDNPEEIASQYVSEEERKDGYDVRKPIIERETNSQYYDYNGKNIFVKVYAGSDKTDSEGLKMYFISDFSAASSTKKYTRGKLGKLATPKNLRWISGKPLTLTWDKVANADYYYIHIFDADSEDHEHPLEMTSQYVSEEERKNGYDVRKAIIERETNSQYYDYNGKNIFVKVYACTDKTDSEGLKMYIVSDFSVASSTKKYTRNKLGKLATPKNLRWISGKPLTLTWDKVANADHYYIHIYDADSEDRENPEEITSQYVSEEERKNGYDVRKAIIEKETNSHYYDYNGKNIFVKVYAGSDKTDSEGFKLYIVSNFSTASSVKQYIRKLTIRTGDDISVIDQLEMGDTIYDSLTDDQKKKAGDDEVFVDITNTPKDDTAEGAEEIRRFGFNKFFIVSVYFDITLLARTARRSLGNVTDTVKPIHLSVPIPEDIKMPGRVYIILRYHNGVVTEVGRGTGDEVDFFTDRFSTYAIAYEDASEEAQKEIRETQINDFVDRMYKHVLNRVPEADGLNNWTSQLAEGKIDGATLAQGFVASEEFTNRNLNDRDYIVTLYSAFFDRTPAEDEIQYWLGEFGKGRGRMGILSGFVNSVEFANLCEDYGMPRGTMEEDGTVYFNEGVRKFVQRNYEKALGRKGEVAGVEDWSHRINLKAMTPLDVAQNFFHSEEFLNKNTSNEEYVTILYRTFLGREPEQVGFDIWLAELEAGTDRDKVLQGFAFSQEFHDIMAQYGL